MKATSLRTAIVQLTSTNDTAENQSLILESLERIDAQARADGTSPDLVVFPENVWFLRLAEGEKFPDFGAKASDGFRRQLQAWSDRSGAAIVLGSVPIRDGSSIVESAKPHAAMVVFEPKQPWSVVYRKIHLFDVDVAGHRPVRESDHLAPGLEPKIWTFKGWSFGCAICYDVRFAELFSLYAAKSVDALFLPSAFLVPTGRQHWEILVRARAIESQAYMLAPAQSGDHVDRKTAGSGALGQAGDIAGASGAIATATATPRKTYGRSLAVDPWGRVLAAAAVEKSGIEILIVDLNKDEIQKVRGQIPMKSHRRLSPHVLASRETQA